MKRQQLLDLGIRPKTIDEMEVDVVQAVLDEEFRERPVGLGPGRDYRTRTVDRLVSMGCQWHSDHNTFGTVATRYLQVKCPYCSELMKVSGCSGNSSELTASYMCHCGATGQAALPPDGISFVPPIKR